METFWYKKCVQILIALYNVMNKSQVKKIKREQFFSYLFKLINFTVDSKRNTTLDLGRNANLQNGGLAL